MSLVKPFCLTSSSTWQKKMVSSLSLEHGRKDIAIWEQPYKNQDNSSRNHETTKPLTTAPSCQDLAPSTLAAAEKP